MATRDPLSLPNCMGRLNISENSVTINLTTITAMGTMTSILTLILCVMFMVTLVKTRALHTPSNMLLGGLCISDILVGLVVQPIFLLDINQKNRCAITKNVSFSLQLTVALCCGWSFLFVVLITLDRFAAIHYPFRYECAATVKTHLAIGGIGTLFWAIFSTITIGFDLKYFLYGYMGIGTLAVICIVICYVSIARVMLKHRTKITTLGTISEEGVENRTQVQDQKQERERDQTHIVACILGLFLVCFLPMFIYHLFKLVYKPSIDEVAKYRLTVTPWVDLCVLVNSCLNPLAYYIRSKVIREAVLKIF